MKRQLFGDIKLKEMPPHIKKMVSVVKRISAEGHFISPAKKKNLNFARLEIASWVCRSEGLSVTRGNILSILEDEMEEAKVVRETTVMVESGLRHKCQIFN